MPKAGCDSYNRQASTQFPAQPLPSWGTLANLFGLSEPQLPFLCPKSPNEVAVLRGQLHHTQGLLGAECRPGEVPSSGIGERKRASPSPEADKAGGNVGKSPSVLATNVGKGPIECWSPRSYQSLLTQDPKQREATSALGHARTLPRFCCL